ncbi:hypothetical protein MSIBF_A1730014 [groundwater metagenome]|uniref:Uncharacterized protein n=1 Tax=groundwater metagenome TaxID=717931 RepID=A0A098EA33_9ZZZZ
MTTFNVFNEFLSLINVTIQPPQKLKVNFFDFFKFFEIFHR